VKLWWFAIPFTLLLVVACIAGGIEQWWRGRGKG
jgi:hypothetical protein